MEQAPGHAVGERSLDSLSGRTVKRTAIRVGGLANVEMALWRDVYLKRHGSIRVPSYGHGQCEWGMLNSSSL